MEDSDPSSNEEKFNIISKKPCDWEPCYKETFLATV